MSSAFIVFGAVTVKNANLIKDNANYSLQHYRTIVLEIENNIVTKIMNKNNNNFYSMSTSRAISQALEYLGLPKDSKVGDQFQGDRLG